MSHCFYEKIKQHTRTTLQRDKQEHYKHKKKIAIEYPLLGLQIQKVFLRGWHQTPLSTYLLFCVVMHCLVLLRTLCCLCSCLLVFNFVLFDHCFLLFWSRKQANCISTPILFNIVWFTCFINRIVHRFVEKKKKNERKKNEKEKNNKKEECLECSSSRPVPPRAVWSHHSSLFLLQKHPA